MKYILQILNNGIRFLIRQEDNSDKTVIREVWIDKIYFHPKFKIKKDFIVIDIGAHIGCFTVYAGKQAKKVFSYEPEPKSFQLLKKNIKINNLSNVKAFNCAVLNKREEAKLFLQKRSICNSIYLKTNKFITVKTISLKDIFKENKINFCHLLKIDTEGSEYDILHSTPRKYLNKIGFIILEYHDRIFKMTCNKLIGFLTKRGFVVESLSPEKFTGLLFAKKTKSSGVKLFCKNYFMLYISRVRYYLNLPSRLPDKFLGKIGIFLKNNFPKLYYKLKKIKKWKIRKFQ